MEEQGPAAFGLFHDPTGPFIAKDGYIFVVDMDGGVDAGLPEGPDAIFYVYHPIRDEDLPNLAKIEALGRLVADLVCGVRVPVPALPDALGGIGKTKMVLLSIGFGMLFGLVALLLIEARRALAKVVRPFENRPYHVAAAGGVARESQLIDNRTPQIESEPVIRLAFFAERDT